MGTFGQNQNLQHDKAEALRAIRTAVHTVLGAEGFPDLGEIYMRKEQQAKAVKAIPLADVNPDHVDYRLVRKDMIVDGFTNIHEAADAIIAEASRMTSIAASLEQWRRTSKKAVNAATSRPEVQAVDVSLQSLVAFIQTDSGETL